MSGIAGTPPAGAYEGATVSIVSFTGVAARNAGYAMGAILIALAFLPKVSAFLVAIPNPVIGMFLMMVMGLLLVEGMRTVFQEGIDYRKALVVSVSLSVGLGLESQDIFSELVGGVWGALLGNGLAGGAQAAVLMTAFLELSGARRLRLETELAMSALPRMDEFLERAAARGGVGRGIRRAAALGGRGDAVQPVAGTGGRRSPAPGHPGSPVGRDGGTGIPGGAE